MHLLGRSLKLNIAGERLGSMGARVAAITVLQSYGRGSILRTSNLSCLGVSLYPVFDMSARFCPLWAAPCSWAVSCPDEFSVPGKLRLELPPPCGANSSVPGPLTLASFPLRPLPHTLFLLPSLSQTGKPFSHRSSMARSL